MQSAARTFEASEKRPHSSPHPFLYVLEGPRALFESSTLLPALPLLRAAPKGDGHPVVFLPGFMASDRSTRVLRRYFKDLGYAQHPWKLGRNLGPSGDIPERMSARVAELFDRYDRKVSIVGWSLGGIYAREIARGAPEMVRQVITLGSPFRGGSRSSNISWVYQRLNRNGRHRNADIGVEERRVPPPVPSTAIYTKTDGVVSWEACMEEHGPQTDNIEVIGSHCGLGFNPAVLYAIADRLSQDEDAWRPFDRSGWRSSVYA